MANSAHFDKLLEGIAAWNQWRQDAPDIQPDLSEAVIGDEDFLTQYQDDIGVTHLDFSQANFHAVNFNRTLLCSLNLAQADLTDATFQHAKLENIICHSGDFSSADLSHAELTNPDFRDCNLQSINITQAKFWNANLQGCNLWGATLDDAVLSGVDLTGADLQGASLIHANLEGANLSNTNCWSSNLFRANLWNANFEASNLSDTNFSQAILKGAIMKRAQMDGASFQDADLWRADIRYADLTRTNFVNAHVTGIQYNKYSTYRGIRTSACYGSPRFKRFAEDQDYVEEFRTLTWDPLAQLRRRYAWPWAKPIPTGNYLYWIWHLTSDCGRSLTRWSIVIVLQAIAFGIIFYLLGQDSFHLNSYDEHGLPWSLNTMIYYSVITFSTLGFGDIVPQNTLAARWVIAEVITGYVMLGGLISILAGKLARRA